MAEPGLAGRPKRRRRSLTRQDKAAPPAPDLLPRDFSAPAPNIKWCGDRTEIPTEEGALYLAATEDLFSGACPASRSAPTTTPSWPRPRSRWRSRPAAAPHGG